MPLSDKGTRKLPYPLSKTFEPIAETPNDGTPQQVISGFPDETTKVSVTMTLSLDEYVALATAIDVGRDIAFAEDSELIWWVWCRAFSEGTVMSCEQVADCIETDAGVLAALLAQLAANGFTPNPDSAEAPTPVQLTPAQSGQGLLPSTMDCTNHAQNMAVARAIVRELNESVQDAFETLELATNINEAAGIVLGAVPVAGTGAKVIELADWVQQTVVESYQAAYNQSSEDDIACAIFCHIEANCEISLDSLLSIYETLGTITVPAIETIDDLIGFIVTTTIAIDTTGVAVFQYFLLHALKFGGVVFEISGFNDLANIIETAATYQDFSYDDCGDCPIVELPETYWRVLIDFAAGMGDWEIPSGFGTFSGGVLSNTGNPSIARAQLMDLGSQCTICGQAIQYQGRGFTGIAADALSFQTFSAVNLGGTVLSPLSTGNLSGNTNTEQQGWFTTTPGLMVGNVRSTRANLNNGGVGAYPSNFGKITKLVFYGLTSGGVKPPNAQWVASADFPTSVAEMFQ